MQVHPEILEKSSGKVSGPTVVVILFSGAFLLFAIIFLIAFRQKLSDQHRLANQSTSTFSDSATTRETMHAWMTALPVEWIKVTKVEGQGFVVFVPCYSSNAKISLQSSPDSLPRLACEYCDSSTNFTITSIALARSDSAWEFRLQPDEGRLKLLRVNDSLLLNFPEAPFQDKLLLWTHSQESGRIDSMIFVPKSQESEFEVLHAEDENPEGCGDGASD